uniref:C1q domain-containing protein n=1 Tax=Cyprinus carpio carpio TaxID=630221 RepID=A0A9J8D2D1_CYPCA
MLYRRNMDMRSIVEVLVCLFFGQCALIPGYHATEFGLLPNDTQGQTGFSEPDLSYCQMILEAPVPPTADQVPWFCICSACSGNQGPQGLCNCKDGAQGAQGQTGAKGEKGNLGPTGQQGATGATGPKGDQGDMGMTGMPGPCSPTVQSTFSAALLTSFPLPSRPVPFKRVIYNLNQNYNPDNGVYTAPVNGTYVFSYHLQVSSRMLKVGLFHNFEAVVRTTTPVEMNTASQQVVLSLSQGDWVWVQVKDTTTNGVYTGSEASSTFSGFLLYPDRCDDMFGRDFNNNEFPNNDIPWDSPPKS